MDKTKHIHDMVINQKAQTEPHQKSSSPKSYYRERERNDNYQPLNWRQNGNRLLLNNRNYKEKPVNAKNDEQHELLIPSAESNDVSDGLLENNCFYQDNCNYL